MGRLIRSASLTNYAEVALRAGLDPARMLAEFRIPLAALRELEMRVPGPAVRDLLEASAARSGVESFGLQMAATRKLSSLGPLGLLLREQPTKRAAVEALARYANRLNDALYLTLEDAGAVAVLREELILGGSGSIRQATELAIGVAFRALQVLLGAEWKPRRVCFAHDAPRDRAMHLRFFGPHVEFGHDFNGIVCARADLEGDIPEADPVMARYAHDLLEASFAHRGHDMTAQVREAIVATLGMGTCSVEAIAKQLGVNRRTIHRHLVNEGQTFSGIVDQVRRELASRYIADKHRSLAEVSELLGFAAPSGFSRWHRRHFARPASQRRPRAARRKRR